MHTYKINDMWSGAILTVEASSDERLYEWAERELKHPARWLIDTKDGVDYREQLEKEAMK